MNCLHKIAIAGSTKQPCFTNQIFTNSFGHVQSLICWRSQVQANSLIGHAGILNCKRGRRKSNATNIYTTKCAMHPEIHPTHTHKNHSIISSRVQVHPWILRLRNMLLSTASTEKKICSHSLFPVVVRGVEGNEWSLCCNCTYES